MSESKRKIFTGAQKAKVALEVIKGTKTINEIAQDFGVHLPGVHRVASLVKRWLLGTHQGSIGTDHMQAYLYEFMFRFNRRGARARGMLFYRLCQ